jgi:hypothetical protein
MDLTRIIEQLYAERHRVRQGIATPEQFQQQRNIAVPAHRTRGRKSMGTEERKVVAERMKTYWAKRNVGLLVERQKDQNNLQPLPPLPCVFRQLVAPFLEKRLTSRVNPIGAVRPNMTGYGNRHLHAAAGEAQS